MCEDITAMEDQNVVRSEEGRKENRSPRFQRTTTAGGSTRIPDGALTNCHLTGGACGRINFPTLPLQCNRAG